MGSKRKLWLVVNRDSGSNNPETVERLTQALGASSQSLDRVIDCQCDELPTASALDAVGADRLVVFTGDGTLNAVCSGLEGWTGEIAVLPGGTANLLSHSLHGEAEADAIAAALVADQLRPVRRPCIESSQGIALIELLAGPGATWSDVREELREGDIGALATKAVDAVRQSATGPMVAIVAPAMGKDTGYSGVRLAPEGNRMCVEGYAAETVADYLKQGVALLRRNFREGPHDDLGKVGELTCRSLEGTPIELMLDGERKTGGAQERFRVRPFDLTFLASPQEGLHG